MIKLKKYELSGSGFRELKKYGFSRSGFKELKKYGFSGSGFRKLKIRVQGAEKVRIQWIRVKLA